MIKYILVLVLFLCFHCVIGQTIKGLLVDRQGNPLDGYNVTLLKADNSSVVKIELSNATGYFEFSSLENGIYKMLYSFYDFSKVDNRTIVLNVENQDIDLGEIELSGASFELDEVVMVKRKPYVEQKIDRTVVNVGAVINNIGVSALEVLDKSPGIRIDENGQINLRGKSGVMVFVDDKATYLSGPDLEAYLSSLSSSSIESIEIMTNPPAKYDAAGNAGIINIITKKDNNSGFNLGINSSILQHKYTLTSHSINFNYKVNKINFYGSTGYMNRNNFINLDIDRSFLERDTLVSYLDQYSFIRRRGHQLQTKLGLDYYINDQSTIGVSVSGLSRYPKSKINTSSEVFDYQSNLDSITTTRNTEDGKYRNLTANVNFRHNFQKNDGNLVFNYDVLGYKIGNDQKFIDANFIPGSTSISEDILLGNLNTNIGIQSLKVDYSSSIGERSSIATGAKLSYTRTENVAEYNDDINGQVTPNYYFTNSFNYDENIKAVYMSYKLDLNKISFKAGIRYEQTKLEGNQLGNAVQNDSTFTRKYDAIFPTVFLLYKIDSLQNHQLRLNYGKRIDRPYYQDLNPFITPLNKYTFYSGNPYLSPSYSDKIELSYIFKKRTTLTIGYSKSTDQINETIEISDNLYFSRPNNIGNTEVLSTSLDGYYEFTNWFNFRFYGGLDYVNIFSDFYGGTLDVNGFNGYIQSGLEFDLSDSWSAQINGNYQTRIKRAQFILGSKGSLNLGISKKINSSTTLRLAVNDLLYTNINRGDITNLNNSRAYFRNLGDTRNVVLSFTKNFGKDFDSKKYRSDGADEESGRVK